MTAYLNSKFLALILFVFLTLGQYSYGQSNNCTSIPSLPVNTICTTTSFSVSQNGTGVEEINASCAVPGTAYSDGWYTVTGTGNNITISVSNTDRATVLAVFTSCGGGTELDCDIQTAGSDLSVSFASTATTTYYVQIQRRSGNTNANLTGDICAYESLPIPDDCGSALDLGTLTSPYSESTTGDANDFSACGGSAGDHIYYMDVPVGSTFTIQQTSNNFDSEQSLTYGGACPGSTTLFCSDTDLTTFVWQNCTGSTQRVYWINDGWGSGEGDYTFEWSLVAGTCPANPDDCGSAVDLATITSPYSNTTTGVNNDFSTCGGSAGDHIYFMDVPVGSTFTVQQTTNSFDSEQSLTYGGACPGSTTIFCSDSDLTTFVWQNCTGSTQRVYWINDGWGSGEGTYTFQWSLVAGTCPVPPANDDCAGAVVLTVNPDLNCGTTTSGTVENATASAQSTAACFGTENNDVWYKFTATSTIHEIDLLNVSGFTDMYHSVWSGTCPTLSLVTGSCSDPNSSTVTGLTIGQVYHVRVNTYGSSATTTTFDICIGTPPPPPANDDCANATNLPCGTSALAGTTINTVSETHGVGCSMSDYGVWYTFTGNGQETTLTVNSTTDMEIGVASGTCGGLTNMSCTDAGNPETVTFIATNGETYYVYVGYYSSFGSTTGNFTISRSCSAPPACSADMSINTTTYSNTGLTTCGFGDDFNSSDACGSSYMNGDDIVIAYTPTSNSCVNISLSNTDSYTGVFVTNGCPDNTSSLCVASNTSWTGNPSINSLNVLSGTTYYITVSTSPSPQCTAFDLDIVACPPPPPNDDCANAIGLTVNPDRVCNSVTAGTISSATASVDANSCSGTDDDDVWFSFVATSATHYIEIDNVVGSVTDMYHSVFTGSCGSLGAALECSDANISTITGLTFGQTYFVRVYTYTSTPGQSVDFDICVTSPNPPPPNDDCSNAIALTMNGENCISTTGGYTESATLSIAGCTGTADDDVWFSFEATATSHDLSIINATGTTDMVHEVFSGTCGSLFSLNCSDPNTSTITGLTVGVTYYVRVYTYSNGAVNTGFEICITGPCVADPTPTCNLGYTMSTITHAPVNYNTGTTLTFSDDRFADDFSSIGFPFCFDGVTYNNCLVSSNGYISFPHCLTEIPDGNMVTGGYSPYTIDAAIPNNTDAPTNSIMLWHDIDPSKGGDIRTNIEGTAPNRIFVVKYDNLAMYSCNSDLFSAQIMLYETTNDIEIHVTEKNVCSTWNGGDAILGLNNYDGTIARTTAALNYPTNWTATDDGYKFTFGCPTCAALLPIELVSFEGEAFEDFNLLSWKTASEENNSHFILEKSYNGAQFIEIAKIDGAGSSSQELTYEYQDYNNDSPAYYRLRQVDYDGEKSYSKIIYLETTSTEFKVYPNPTDGLVNIRFNSTLNLSTIELTNYLGVIVKVIEIESSSVEMNLSDLPKGIYFIKSLDKNGYQVGIEKLILR